MVPTPLRANLANLVLQEPMQLKTEVTVNIALLDIFRLEERNLAVFVLQELSQMFINGVVRTVRKALGRILVILSA